MFLLHSPRWSRSDFFVLIDYFVFDYLEVDFTYDVGVATVVPLFRFPLQKLCHFLLILRQGSNKIRFRENALNAIEKVSMFTGREWDVKEGVELLWKNVVPSLTVGHESLRGGAVETRHDIPRLRK